MKKGFLPHEADGEKVVERWLKISIAHLFDQQFEAIVRPIMTLGMDVVHVLSDQDNALMVRDEELKNLTKPIMEALINTSKMTKIKNESSFIKKNALTINHLENLDAEKIKNNLSKINFSFTEEQITSLLDLSMQFKQLLSNICVKSDMFIKDCQSVGIGDEKIDACYKKYEKLVNAEVQTLTQRILPSVLSGRKIPALSALPEMPPKPVGVKIIEDAKCCPSILHAFGLNRKTNAIVSANNRVEEEKKEDYKPQRIKI
ncbi:MAG: hypothetical protein RLZ35_418 [Pseudomonadota bacterium]